MPPPKGQAAASPPFASRELNGEVLLDELLELKAAQVPQRHINDCVLVLRDLDGLRVPDAAGRLKQIASSRFAGQPALAALLVRWAQKLKTDADVQLLVAHLERLALATALVAAVRRGTERLPRGARP
jgi:hypothetical protein